MTAAPTFTELTRQLDYSMFIVTTAAEGERAGCLVGFATQVSIHPGRFLVCLSNKNRTFRVAARATVLVVHFVPAGRRTSPHCSGARPAMTSTSSAAAAGGRDLRGHPS